MQYPSESRNALTGIETRCCLRRPYRLTLSESRNALTGIETNDVADKLHLGGFGLNQEMP